eukprot:16435112-Heterocapsa_arctica.AAC.1
MFREVGFAHASHSLALRPARAERFVALIRFPVHVMLDAVEDVLDVLQVRLGKGSSLLFHLCAAGFIACVAY